MIYFNGRALESVAPVRIADISISPIKLSVTARQRPVEAGAEFVRIRGGARTVGITFSILTENIEARQRALQNITDWARTPEPGVLRLPGNDGRYLECICTGLPEPSMRQWWESRLRLTFTTVGNPYWTSDVEHSAACGTAFTVLGSAEPLMQIRHTLPETYGFEVEYSRSDESMSWWSIPAGNLVIDLNRQTAAVDGASIMDQYNYADSVFLLPKTGTQTITGIGTIFWRERWQ